jgi:hypothetical protein
MVLKVQVPQEVTVFYGKYRNRMSAVEDLVPLITSVRAIRRIFIDGRRDEVAIEADAFIPPHHRKSILGPRSKWIDDEYRRCLVYIQDNRKTLAPFIASGELEQKIVEND